mmetsp:Transcript_11132/g.31551  ORF Transcript_11132/g.31551 Transcript_11132/m.31551 type:complete len:86 (+) Transcript_11132:64-321(+)
MLQQQGRAPTPLFILLFPKHRVPPLAVCKPHLLTPAASSMGASRPSRWSVMIPGPSLQPPMPSPPMKMFGMDVRPVFLASSALMA